jgi:hypothetical protein
MNVYVNIWSRVSIGTLICKEKKILTGITPYGGTPNREYSALPAGPGGAER